MSTELVLAADIGGTKLAAGLVRQDVRDNGDNRQENGARKRDTAHRIVQVIGSGIARTNAGGYGLGIQYAKSMFGSEEGH